MCLLMTLFVKYLLDFIYMVLHTLLKKQLTTEQQRKLKELYNKASDNVKDYCLECLRIDGILVK